MSVRPKFGDEVGDRLREKVVEVSLVGGTKTSIEGKLFASQDDYIIVAVGDAPEGRFYIPISAVAFVRLKGSPT